MAPMPVFEGDVLLGHVDVVLPQSSSGGGDRKEPAVLFPSNEIRISRRSPASDRCPPLAVLQVISAYSMRCKLRENTTFHPTSPSLLASLHSTCWNQRMDPTSSYFVNIRPGWDDLKSDLITTSGCRRYKVYVCTMAGKYYALEVWRLLDPEGNLIRSEEISQRLICVNPDSKKSLRRVFRKSLGHPNMAMVIDDRLDVWAAKDKRRVHNLPAYNPSAAPEDEVVHGRGVLQILRNTISKVHQGFFSEFDGMLLKAVDELMYESDVLDLPCPPDVGDYLQPKNDKFLRHGDAPISPENISRAEVESASKN